MHSQAPQPVSNPRVAIAITLHHSEPWFINCYQGVLKYAHENNWSCVLDPYLLGVKEESDIAGYHGVVGRIGPEAAAAAAAHGIPIVNHWRNSPVADLPCVMIDEHEGGRLAGEHLAMSGYRSFAMIDLEILAHNLGTREGFANAVASLGFAVPEYLVISGDLADERQWLINFRHTLIDWLQQTPKPVGVLVRFYPLSRYLAQLCSELGLRVPEDVGIVANTDDAVITTSASPTISAVEYDYVQMGYESAALLDRLMKGQPADPLRKLIPPRRLVVRESSDVFLSTDPMISQAMQLIALNSNQNLRVEDVAGGLDTSRRTLERRFEQVLGRSVYSEIVRLRISHIKRALEESDWPMTEIAKRCGFSTASHFTRLFRKETGMTPSAYRKLQYRDDRP